MKKGVITHPYGVGFLIGLAAGIIIGAIITYIMVSGDYSIPFVGG